MITSKIIKEIYKIHNSPQNANLNEIKEFLEITQENHLIRQEQDYLLLIALPDDSPFRKIPIDRIRGIEKFEKVIALVLPSCILFFSMETDDINIHIKLPNETFSEKIIKKIKNLF